VVTERPVGLYIDGLYYSRVQGSLLSLVDAERIDVLRGPQGTLFGRNTTGGAVAYISKAPTDEFEGFLKGTVGEFNRRDIQGVVNIPFGDTAALKLSAAKLTQDGYVDRGDIDLGNIDDTVAKAQLRLEPSDSLSIDFSASFSETNSNGDPRTIDEVNLNGTSAARFFDALQISLQNQGEGPLVEDDPRLVLDDYSVPAYCNLDGDGNPYTFGPECETKVKAKMNVQSLTVNWDISETLAFKSITGRLAGDQTQNVDRVWTGGYARPFTHDFENFQQEFQLSFTNDKLFWVSGLVYFSEDGSEEEITTEIRTSGGFGLTPDEINAGLSTTRRDESYTSEVESYGFFSQLTYNITDKLDITLGGRYSEDEKTVEIEYVPTADDPYEASGSGSESWDDVDWRLALSYDITDDVMVYGSITDAYKAGIADDSSIEDRDNTRNSIVFIPPEYAKGYELGFRSEWMDGRLRLNGTIYRTDYTNRQAVELISEIDGVPLDQPFLQSQNLGDVEFDGYEADFAFVISQSLTVEGSYGVTNYELLDTPDETLEGVPEVSATLGLTHDAEFGVGKSITSSLRYAWTDETYAANEPAGDYNNHVNESRGILNGRVEYVHSENVSLAIYGTNLTDENYGTQAYEQTFHIGGNSTNQRVVKGRFMGQPRALGVELKYNF
jgi:iron complex outermembrane receptor protein